MPNRVLTDEEIVHVLATQGNGGSISGHWDRELIIVARRIEALVIERVGADAPSKYHCPRCYGIDEDCVRDERLTLGKHEGADTEYSACPHNRQEICAECKRVIAERQRASDSLAQDDKEVMPDEVRNAGREVNIAATVGKRAAPGVANGGGASGLAQDEIDRRIIAAIDAHYCWCQRCIDGITPCVGANAVDALASLARRLLAQVRAYEGMDKAVDVYRERAEVAERLHDAHCMESGIPKVPDCRPPWRTGR